MAKSVSNTARSNPFGTAVSITVSNPHIGVSVSTFDPTENLLLMHKCMEVFHSLRDGPDHANVVNHTVADIFDRKAWMVVATKDKQVFAAGHAHVDEKKCLWLRGLAARPDSSGMKIGSALAAVAIQHGCIAGHDVTAAVASIRMFRDGTLNERSRHSLERVGFKLDKGSDTRRLAGSHRDAHLLDSADLDELGPFTTFRLLRATPDIVDKSRAFLSEWVQMHQRLPMLQRA